MIPSGFNKASWFPVKKEVTEHLDYGVPDVPDRAPRN